mmetsp:Transcript_6556/g.11246  ORF Transcript_6556/g.11246 Transcript_6556/m.11246 type:complete len:253 (-) Transcript_6556:195-953(-)
MKRAATSLHSRKDSCECSRSRFSDSRASSTSFSRSRSSFTLGSSSPGESPRSSKLGQLKPSCCSACFKLDKSARKWCRLIVCFCSISSCLLRSCVASVRKDNTSATMPSGPEGLFRRASHMLSLSCSFILSSSASCSFLAATSNSAFAACACSKSFCNSEVSRSASVPNSSMEVLATSTSCLRFSICSSFSSIISSWAFSCCSNIAKRSCELGSAPPASQSCLSWASFSPNIASCERHFCSNSAKRCCIRSS